MKHWCAIDLLGRAACATSVEGGGGRPYEKRDIPTHLTEEEEEKNASFFFLRNSKLANKLGKREKEKKYSNVVVPIYVRRYQVDNEFVFAVLKCNTRGSKNDTITNTIFLAEKQPINIVVYF